MTIVRFLNTDEGPVEVDVPVGTSILQAAQKGHVPEGSACGGVCACSTCHVYVRKGIDLLTEAEDEELDILDKAFAVESTSRLGCQAKIERDGELVVELSRESVDTWYNEHPQERHARDARLKKGS